MISITAIIKSKPENLEEVKNMIHHLVTETRKEAACVRYDLHTTENVFYHLGRMERPTRT